MRIPPIHVIIDTVTATVTVASFVCNVLPKSTVFADYPRVKAAYETGINFVIGLALNWRQCQPSLEVLPVWGHKPESQDARVVKP